MFVAAVGTICMAADEGQSEITYKSIGQGWMTDDMVTGWYGYLPVTYAVEIQQAQDDSPFYRVIAPYGQAFADAMKKVNNVALKAGQYDSEGKCYIDIDATDPNNAIFHKTMTGCNWGDGEMYIGINTRYEMTLVDKVFRAPMLGIAVGDDTGAIAGNRRGKFRIVLPGGKLDDYDVKVTPESQCLTERTFKATVSIGQDVAEARYYVFPDMQEDEIVKTVQTIAEQGPVFKPRGEFSYEMGKVKKETFILVALDGQGDIVGYDWCTYYFIDDNADNWTDCGMAEFTDGFLQSVISNIPSQTTKCMLQQNKENPKRYRLVNPYSGLKEYAALNKGHEGHNHYIDINAEDPECIYIEESPIGMESSVYGMMRVSSAVDYYLHAGFDIEDCKELEYGAVVENGVMTFNEEALLVSLLKYENGDWLITDPEGVTTIKLPEGFDITTAVSDIKTDDSAAPVEYYNLYGVKLKQPAAGQVCIRRQGSKVTKEIIR